MTVRDVITKAREEGKDYDIFPKIEMPYVLHWQDHQEYTHLLLLNYGSTRWEDIIFYAVKGTLETPLGEPDWDMSDEVTLLRSYNEKNL